MCAQLRVRHSNSALQRISALSCNLAGGNAFAVLDPEFVIHIDEACDDAALRAAKSHRRE